ncbi:prolipoprotein diacylglyceryl transferase [Sphingobacterium suaedae]|uniref:Prolipoprotein diacylglyceryl transferase n=1 Tax=Sphingobacterium suaedae TaxID=1686402 RepID=A0ABW5KJ15_9SPHI
MFPTLSSLINYVFGTNFNWPVPTFGFFVSLAFVLSYLTFRAEFKRKQESGVFIAFRGEVKWGTTEKSLLLLGYGLFGFLVGYKGIGALLNRESFYRNPLGFIFSADGNWTAGLTLAIVCAMTFCLVYRKILFSSSTIQSKDVQPTRVLPVMLLWAGISGFVGSKVFNLLENGDLHHSHGFLEILNFSGLTFFGGLIFGGVSYFYIGMRKGMGWRHLADVGSLGMLVAYGVGRMGCHLSGDGDWGIVNAVEKPLRWIPDWLWSFRFPHNVLGQGDYIPECSGKYCYILPQGVFPTSLYESIIILAVFVVLWLVKSKIRIPGLLFVLYLFVTGTERFLIEFIRLNYRFDVFGISVSEAQLIGAFMILSSFLLGVYLLRKMKERNRADEIHVSV